MTGRALANPEAKGSAITVAQFLDNQAGRARAIHKDGHLRPLDDDADVKPFIAVGFRYHSLFILVGVLRSE